jgi:hypothetical protein
MLVWHKNLAASWPHILVLYCGAAACLQEWAASGGSFVQQVQQLVSDTQLQLPAALTDPTAPDGPPQQQKLWAVDAGAADVTFIITLYEHVAAALMDMRVKVRGACCRGALER